MKWFLWEWKISNQVMMRCSSGGPVFYRSETDRWRDANFSNKRYAVRFSICPIYWAIYSWCPRILHLPSAGDKWWDVWGYREVFRTVASETICNRIKKALRIQFRNAFYCLFSTEWYAIFDFGKWVLFVNAVIEHDAI